MLLLRIAVRDKDALLIFGHGHARPQNLGSNIKTNTAVQSLRLCQWPGEDSHLLDFTGMIVVTFRGLELQFR